MLTDRNSSIAVRVERTRARANVRGLGKPDACRLDYALRTEDMIEGDALVTSGTDGVFPRGLPVGRVTQLERNAARAVPGRARRPRGGRDAARGGARRSPPGSGRRRVLPAAYAPGKRREAARPRRSSRCSSRRCRPRSCAGSAAARSRVALLAACVVYLGLHGGNVDGSVAAAGIGYVLDLMAGTPKGLMTFLAVLLFVVVRAVSAAVDVRGRGAFVLLSGAGALFLSLGATHPPAQHDRARRPRPGAAARPAHAPRGAPHRRSLAPVVLVGLQRIDALFHREEPGLLR